MPSAKTNGGLEDAARLLDLVPFINSHQGISIAELAKQFSVTPDVITEDLQTLWLCGLPGYTPYELIDLSFDSGFVTISNAETLQHPRTLQRNEALALLLGLETLVEEVGGTNADLAVSIRSLISKISGIVDQGAAQKVKAGSGSSSELRARLRKSLESREALRITYHSSAIDLVGERIIEPLEFIVTNEMEYLEAYCHKAKGYRTFRLDRILSAEGVDVIARQPQPVVGKVPPRHSTLLDFEVKVLSRNRDVYERFGAEGSIVEPRNEIHSQSFNPEWSVRQVMSLGGAAEISSPESLRSAVHQRALITLNQYSRDSGLG